MQGFGFTGDFLGECNNTVYSQAQKIACRFKELVSAHHSCQKGWLVLQLYWVDTGIPTVCMVSFRVMIILLICRIKINVAG